MSNSHGVITTDQGSPRVTFERILDAAMDVVWAMLTTSEGLERWLAPASVELRVGGAVDIDFGEGEVVGGEIVDLVPGSSLEYHWRFTGEPDSMVRFELEAIDPGRTKLRLDHRLLPEEQAVGYGAGWHAHLDQMVSQLVGTNTFDWDERFSALMPEYQNRVSSGL